MSEIPVSKIVKLKKVKGIAGQFSYLVNVEYEEGDISRVEFVSSVYGGGVIMVSGGVQTRVVNPERFGPVLNPAWVRSFFA